MLHLTRQDKRRIGRKRATGGLSPQNHLRVRQEAATRCVKPKVKPDDGKSIKKTFYKFLPRLNFTPPTKRGCKVKLIIKCVVYIYYVLDVHICSNLKYISLQKLSFQYPVLLAVAE